MGKRCVVTGTAVTKNTPDEGLNELQKKEEESTAEVASTEQTTNAR